MLAVTRKQCQAIHIGQDVIVRVGKITRGRVVLLIDAPRSIPVFRDELVEAIRKEQSVPASAQRSIEPMADATSAERKPARKNRPSKSISRRVNREADYRLAK